MNHVIQNLLENSQPKITSLSSKEKKIYEAELQSLGTLICDDFFDIPHILEDRFEGNGLYYEIPYYDLDILYSDNNQRMMIVVYEIKNKSSQCPLRIDFKLDNLKNFSILVYDQSGEKTIVKRFLECENGEYYTNIDNYQTIKLSELLNLNKE